MHDQETMTKSKQKIDRLSAIIGLAIAILTLIGLVAVTFESITGRISSWFGSEPLLIIRSENVNEGDHQADYELKFTIANRKDEPITLNSIELRLGDYVFGSDSRALHWTAFQYFEHVITIEFIGHQDGTPFPQIKEYASEESMGFFVFQLLEKRGALSPRGQVDFSVFARLYRPAEFKGKYPSLWDLGAAIKVEYEDRELEKNVVRYALRDRRRKELHGVTKEDFAVFDDRWHLTPSTRSQ